MTHGILTSTGNVVAWFDTEDEALAALGDLVAEEPEAADEIAAIPFDDEGHACGPAIKGLTLLPHGAPTSPDWTRYSRGRTVCAAIHSISACWTNSVRRPTLTKGIRRLRASS
jgi:hypothetical protein